MIEAGQSEILRAAQRDEAFKNQLSESVSEIIHSLCGIHFWIKYRESAKVISNLLYQVLTTMSNLQTLGEEYTGMVQVNLSKKSLPSKYLQALMIVLNCCGESILLKSINKLEKSIENLPKEHPIQHSARTELIKVSNLLRNFLPLFSKFHKALFYFNGHYYEIAKQLCAINYVLVRYWLKDKSSFFAFKLLGIVSMLHITLNSVSALMNYNNIDLEKRNLATTSKEFHDSCDKCSLCLNVRQYTSVTPCGHLFCWGCIIPWVQEQPKCPLCRKAFQPSRVVFLQNYSNPS